MLIIELVREKSWKAILIDGTRLEYIKVTPGFKSYKRQIIIGQARNEKFRNPQNI